MVDAEGVRKLVNSSYHTSKTNSILTVYLVKWAKRRSRKQCDWKKKQSRRLGDVSFMHTTREQTKETIGRRCNERDILLASQ